MAIWLTAESRILVQNMTGREGSKHTRRMLASGAQVVAGVNPGKGGQDFEGLPLDRYFAPHLVLPYDPTRGCYWGKCTFCAPYPSPTRPRKSSAPTATQRLSVRFVPRSGHTRAKAGVAKLPVYRQQRP